MNDGTAEHKSDARKMRASTPQQAAPVNRAESNSASAAIGSGGVHASIGWSISITVGSGGTKPN